MVDEINNGIYNEVTRYATKGEIGLNLGMLKEFISQSTYEIEDLSEKLGMSSNALNNRLDNKVRFKYGEFFNLLHILKIEDPNIFF